MKIKICLILLFSQLLSAQEVKVGIVGYTLLDNFKVICDKDVIITLDGIKKPYSSFTINKSGVFISGNEETAFNKLTIESDGITTFLSHYGEQPYVGNFEIIYNNGLTIINRVNEIDYLSSVLGSEMGKSFEDEALKAQLLLIKNYYSMKSRRNRNKEWDILNTASVMAYRGEAYSNDKMKSIIKELDKVTLKLNKGTEPLFFSTASGYLLNQECLTSGLDSQPEDAVIGEDNNLSSPFYTFNHSLSEMELLDLIRDSVPIKSIRSTILKKFKGSECVDFIGFVDYSGSTYWLKGYTFVSLMQKKYGSVFKSIQFSVYKENSYFHFEGKGFGHFVGLSQYGAQEMALKGSCYKEILSFYFPGSQIN